MMIPLSGWTGAGLALAFVLLATLVVLTFRGEARARRRRDETL